MPPKKQETSKKADAKKREKVVEDKTFGMKNKKGAKQQRFIQNVQQQASQMGRSNKELAQQEKDKLEKQTKKDEKKKQLEELNMLFKPVEQKLSKGTDPKSVLCAFFKSGQCGKGDKCKFSHDLMIERKIEKRNMYEDVRDDADNMNNWDEAKLEEVINKKHGENNQSKPKTAIVCKFFLEAVESSKYGWFWSCPNGDSCIYKHALPPGYVLKKDKKKDEKGEDISLEDIIEKEIALIRAKNLTKLTFGSFMLWRDEKKKDKGDASKADREKKKKNLAAGKYQGLTGRELFELNPELANMDDDDTEDGAVVENVKIEEEDDVAAQNVREVDHDTFTKSLQYNVKPPCGDGQPSDATCRLPNGKVFSGEEGYAVGNAQEVDEPIDESLFDGEDLDLVEEELENLDVDD